MQLRCRVAVIAPIGAAGGSHFTCFFSSSFSSSCTSPSLRHQVCGCVRWWRGRRDACFTQPHHRPLANNSRLVAEGGGGCVTFTGCACGCTSSPSSLPLAVLYCLLVPACHMLLTPSHATTTSVMASWPHCPSSPLLSPLCDSTHPISSSSSRGQTAGHTSTRDDDDDTEVCATVCATRGVDAWRAFRPLHVLQPG